MSRSATVVLAHLMKSDQLSVDEAIAFMKKIHPKANPNVGFLEQLQLYEAMGNTVDKTHPVYKQYRLQLLASHIQSKQSVTKDLLSSLIEELKDNTASNDKKYKCRKCLCYSVVIQALTTSLAVVKFHSSGINRISVP